MSTNYTQPSEKHKSNWSVQKSSIKTNYPEPTTRGVVYATTLGFENLSLEEKYQFYSRLDLSNKIRPICLEDYPSFGFINVGQESINWDIKIMRADNGLIDFADPNEIRYFLTVGLGSEISHF